ATFFAGDISVVNSGGGLFTITFQGRFAGTNVDELRLASSTLNAGASVTIATTTQGGPGVNEVQTLQITGATAGNYRLNYGADIVVVDSGGGLFTITFQGRYTGLNVAQLFADNFNLNTGATVT